MQHDTIAAVPAFNVTDSMYDDFKKYLKEQNFDYKTETEDAFEKLQVIASKEKLLDDAKNELDALSEKIKHDKAADLENSKGEIEEFLKEEIVSRYYNQKGRIEMSLLTDPYVQKAVDILNTKTIYTGLLDGTIKNIYADSRDKGNDSN